jgi:hypothetical protein
MLGRRRAQERAADGVYRYRKERDAEGSQTRQTRLALEEGLSRSQTAYRQAVGQEEELGLIVPRRWPGRAAIGEEAGMRRSVFVIGFLCTILAAGALFAAQPGVTAADRARALEFRKRLAADKLARPLTRQLTIVYLLRAYVIDIEPAQAMAKIVARKSLKFNEKNQVKYFGMCLDALIRGANMKDIGPALKDIMKADYGRRDSPFYIDSFLGVASRQASPLPLAKLTRLATKNGMMGRRRKEFIAWVIEQVKRGEDPEHILTMYDAIDGVIISLRGQREYLTKCYNAIRLGAPPLALANAVARMGEKFETERKLNKHTDEILKLHFRGMPLDKAADKVVPPVPKKADDEED